MTLTLFDLTPTPPPKPAPNPNMPTWLKTHIATNQGTTTTLTGDRAQFRKCRCGTWTLNGWDNTHCAFLAQCDPHPLTINEEAAAILYGRKTYQLLQWPHKPHYRHRTPTQETTLKPANPHTHPHKALIVLAEHHCGNPPLTTRTLPQNKTNTTPTNSPPPF